MHNSAQFALLPFRRSQFKTSFLEGTNLGTFLGARFRDVGSFQPNKNSAEPRCLPRFAVQSWGSLSSTGEWCFEQSGDPPTPQALLRRTLYATASSGAQDRSSLSWARSAAACARRLRAWNVSQFPIGPYGIAGHDRRPNAKILDSRDGRTQDGLDVSKMGTGVRCRFRDLRHSLHSPSRTNHATTGRVRSLRLERRNHREDGEALQPHRIRCATRSRSHPPVDSSRLSAPKAESRSVPSAAEELLERFEIGFRLRLETLRPCGVLLRDRFSRPIQIGVHALLLRRHVTTQAEALARLFALQVV